MIKTIQATSLRNNFKSALKHVTETKKPLIVTERGIPTSVLISIDEYEDFLSSKNKTFQASIKQARAEYKNGDVFRMDDVFGKIT